MSGLVLVLLIVLVLSLILGSVLDVALTAITWKVSLPPKYGTIILSPFVTGTLSKASARYLSSIGGIASKGATIIFSAVSTLILLILIVSPIATPTLFLMRPSILMIRFPSSRG